MERFRRTPEPLNSGLSFVPLARPYDQTHFFQARMHWGDRVLAELYIRGRNQYGLSHCPNSNEFFFVPAQVRSALYPHAPDGWHKSNKGPRELCIPTPVVFRYFSHHLLRDSGSGRRLRDIFWTVAALEMTVFKIMAVLDGAYHKVRIYSRVPDLRSYPAPDDLRGGELGRFFCLPPTLLRSIKRFGIERAVRGSRYLAWHAEAVFRQIECILRDETSYPGYCQYS